MLLKRRVLERRNHTVQVLSHAEVAILKILLSIFQHLGQEVHPHVVHVLHVAFYGELALNIVSN